MVRSGNKLEVIKYLKLLPKYGKTTKANKKTPIITHTTLELPLLLFLRLKQYLLLYSIILDSEIKIHILWKFIYLIAQI